MVIKQLNKYYQKMVARAVKCLEASGLVVYPTETCYGLGADATNPKAIERLLQYKRRREGKPFSILVDSFKMANKYADINHDAKNLFNKFLPGPLTIVVQGKNNLAKGVQSEIGTIGIRQSSHPIAQALVKAYGKPITATSANASNQKKPYSTQDVLGPLSEKQKKLLDFIIDAGLLPKRQPSTVVDTTYSTGMVLRQGDLKIKNQTTQIISQSEITTMNFAYELLLKHWENIYHQAVIFNLIGDLGTGKTIFAKGIGQFLKIKQPITSPSYMYLNEYNYQRFNVNGKLYHLDLWRLKDFEDFLKFNLAQLALSSSVIVIEWASKYQRELNAYFKPLNVKKIDISFSDLGKNIRKIQVRD